MATMGPLLPLARHQETGRSPRGRGGWAVFRATPPPPAPALAPSPKLPFRNWGIPLGGAGEEET